MNEELLANEARTSISEYCFTECNAYCCRKGYILLSREEADLLTHNKTDELIEKEVIAIEEGGEYVVDFSKQNCPSLKDNMCTIHKNPNRPKACKEFPLFIWPHKIIHISQRCPAVKENKLYPYLTQFKLMGYTIDMHKDIILD